MSEPQAIGPLKTPGEPAIVGSQMPKGDLGSRTVTYYKTYTVAKQNAKEPETVQVSFEITDGTTLRFKTIPRNLLPEKYKSIDKLKEKDLTAILKETKDSPAFEIFKDILGLLAEEQKKKPNIALGQTDLGTVEKEVYKCMTKDNLKNFSEALETTTEYEEWAEFDEWETKKNIDWSAVMKVRFEKILRERGTIHFNLAGMENDISKIKTLDPRMETGSTGGTLYSDTGWAKAFGPYGITQWELAQILNNRDLLQRTVFYNYDKNKGDVPIPLTPKELAALGITAT